LKIEYETKYGERNGMAKKKKENKSSSGMDIPDYAFESIARSLLPIMQKYYESDEGQQALNEWKETHPEAEKDNGQTT
jgi:hypothetical protein